MHGLFGRGFLSTRKGDQGPAPSTHEPLLLLPCYTCRSTCSFHRRSRKLRQIPCRYSFVCHSFRCPTHPPHTIPTTMADSASPIGIANVCDTLPRPSESMTDFDVAPQPTVHGRFSYSIAHQLMPSIATRLSPSAAPPSQSWSAHRHLSRRIVKILTTAQVAGESGLGKTTFINTLFSTTIKNYADHRRRHQKQIDKTVEIEITKACLLYTSPSPRD